MSPLTVPITILPVRGAPVAARSSLRIAMPAFMAFAAISTSGQQNAVAEVYADDPHALDERLRQHVVGGPSTLEQDADALLDLLLEAVVHLTDELVVGQRAKVEVVVRPLAKLTNVSAARALWS